MGFWNIVVLEGWVVLILMFYFINVCGVLELGGCFLGSIDQQSFEQEQWLSIFEGRISKDVEILVDRMWGLGLSFKL